jgi:acyl carrier protein
MNEHESRIRGVIAQRGRLAIDVAALDAHASLYTAGLTSHASVSVMLALEDEFDVEFPERLLRRSTFESIANLCDAVDQLVGVK